MKITVKFAVLGLAILAIAAAVRHTAAMQTESEYFHDTGHYVSGDFLAFYRAHPRPEAVYGFPITAAFVSPEGFLVQYFQHARFELHPENAPGNRVRLTPLGEYLYQAGESVPVGANPSPCRSFPQTGLEVCRQFLQFFDENGGVSQFGFPISALEYHQGRVVQYFENARLEWHPEHAATGQDVRVSELGTLYFYARGEDLFRLSSEAPLDGAVQVLDLQVHAFPVNPMRAAGDQQRLYVIVQDQTLGPVSGAAVSAQVILPDRRRVVLPMGATNDSGFVHGDIQIPADAPAGLATIEVSAVHPAFSQSTLTSFRILNADN